MKAFLLAAGKGTRLRPLTDSTPKCLLPIRGTPVLAIWMELCRRFGIDEVLINVHAHSDSIRRYLASAHNGVQVHIAEEPVLLGSAGTLAANRSWVASEPAFWVFYGDVLSNVDLGRMLDYHRRRNPVATLGVYEVPDPSRCGILSLDREDVVRDFVEKPAAPAGNLAFAGILLASPALLHAIPDRVPVDIGFDVLPRLAGRSVAYRITEYLVDIGTMENYCAAQRDWPGLASPRLP